MAKRRPPLNIGDRVILKERSKSWDGRKAKRPVYIVESCATDCVEGKARVRLMHFKGGIKFKISLHRRFLYRLDLPPVDMSVYAKGGDNTAFSPQSAMPKSTKAIERREHPVYVGTLAKATFLSDLARDMEAAAKRSLRAFPLCKCCGAPQRVVVKHRDGYSESFFGCDK